MFKNIIKYLKESNEELKKVNWPTKSETLNKTFGVLFLAFVIGIIFTIVDFIFIQIMRLVIK